jgi:hypothetical protein
MNSYIFITTEGYTYQPDSESAEPDIENCQVIGFAEGENKQQAFNNLIQNNQFLLETTFDELICMQLRHYNCWRHKSYFSLNIYRQAFVKNADRQPPTNNNKTLMI